MKYDFDATVDRKNHGSGKWSPSNMKTRFGYDDLLPLWIADMDFTCPKPVIDAIVERAEHGIFGYAATAESYYQSIIDWNQRRNDWEIKKEWLLFTPGIVSALNYMVQTFCEEGDKVLVQEPVYPQFFNAILKNGCQIVSNPLLVVGSKYMMDFDDLAQKAKDPRVKLMFLCSPHNPVGRIWTKEELTRLGKICLENDVIVIADEIHSDLVFKGKRNTPFASISEELANNSIVLTAPSKTFNIAGLKTSNVIISNELLRQKVAIVLEKNGIKSATIFGLVALEAAYNHGEEWLDQVIEYIDENMSFLERFINDKMPEVKFVRPEATYLAWLDLRCLGFNKEELEKWVFTEVKLALNQGYSFGDGGEGFLRLNAACPRSVLEEAMMRLAFAIEDLK